MHNSRPPDPTPEDYEAMSPSRAEYVHRFGTKAQQEWDQEQYDADRHNNQRAGENE